MHTQRSAGAFDRGQVGLAIGPPPWQGVSQSFDTRAFRIVGVTAQGSEHLQFLLRLIGVAQLPVGLRELVVRPLLRGSFVTQATRCGTASAARPSFRRIFAIP